MGTKRKASAFEDDDLFPLQHNPRSSTPSLASSSPASTSTIQSTADNASHTHDPFRVKAVPYWNSRTRKRYRDDRPDEEAIHENTLKKLYDAQRLHLDEAMPMSEVLDFEDSLEPRGDDEDAEMIDSPPEAEIPQTVQRNQRTIDAFFDGRGATQSKAHENESAMAWRGLGT